MKRTRTILFFALKALVSVGIILFLLSQVELRGLLHALSSARLSYLGVGLALYFFGQVLSSLRWAVLARPLGFDHPVREFTVFYFIGMFFNLFAPSTVGGDVGRVFYLARERSPGRPGGPAQPAAAALFSVIADRAVGMGVLVWMGAAALLLFPGYPIPAAIRYTTIALALGLLAVWLVLPYLGRRIPWRGRRLFAALGAALVTYGSNTTVVFQSVMLSLLIHAIQAWMQILLGLSLGVEIPWSYSFILYPLVGVFSALPLSLNGIGLREGGYLFLLRLIDVGAEQAVSFGFLWFLIVALDSLIGGLFFLLRRAPRPDTDLAEIVDQAK